MMMKLFAVPFGFFVALAAAKQHDKVNEELAALAEDIQSLDSADLEKSNLSQLCNGATDCGDWKKGTCWITTLTGGMWFTGCEMAHSTVEADQRQAVACGDMSMFLASKFASDNQLCSGNGGIKAGSGIQIRYDDTGVSKDSRMKELLPECKADDNGNCQALSRIYPSVTCEDGTPAFGKNSPEMAKYHKYLTQALGYGEWTKYTGDTLKSEWTHYKCGSDLTSSQRTTQQADGTFRPCSGPNACCSFSKEVHAAPSSGQYAQWANNKMVTLQWG
jgi:hypothetical protein